MHDVEFSVGEAQSFTVSVTPETATQEGYEPGDPWEIRFQDDDGRWIRIELAPSALHELYTDVTDIGPGVREAGRTTECGLCGSLVELEKAIPDEDDNPVHRHCYLDTYGGPVWLE